MKIIHLFLSACLLCSSGLRAEEVLVAVANNFHIPLKAIAKDFKSVTGHDVAISTGSTGQLYAQIVNGAPFEVFLAADTKRPGKLVEAGLASSEFTYAKGRLVLWTPQQGLFDSGKDALTNPEIGHVALANPEVAPYGMASRQVMEKLGLYTQLKPKLVTGKGLNAIYQFVVTGNAEIGFFAMSQLYKGGEFIPGSKWVIPDELYSPIRQDAVLLKVGFNKPGAESFIQYLTSDRAKRLIAEYGYY